MSTQTAGQAKTGNRRKRVGLLTGGGDCPGLNAAIRAVVKSLLLDVDAQVFGFEEGFLGMVEGRYRELTYQDCSGILNRGGTILGTHNRANPLNWLGKDWSDTVLHHYQYLNLDVVVVLGGDGTMSICHELSKKGMNFIGVPKTIDNDLVGTDKTFGFDTAVSIATDAIDRLRTTAESHKRIMILETMGRYAGWIALHSGLAGGADIILLPEFPYDLNEVVKVCRHQSQWHAYTVIVVAEGAKPLGGDQTVREHLDQSPDPIRLGGVGNALKVQLEPLVDEEVRTTILGHIQRGGEPTADDRIFATQLGVYAASMVARGIYNKLAVIHDNHLASIDLENVANKVRHVTLQDMSLQSALSVGTSFGVTDIKANLMALEDGHYYSG